MSKFNVLSLGEFIHQEGVDISLEAFAILYNDVTSKHQKQMKLSIITKGTLTEYIHQKVIQLGIQKAISIVPWSEQETIEECYGEASIMILPAKENVSKLVAEAFSFGIPVVCYEEEELKETVDSTCGMMVECGTYQENIYNYSDMLRMLYFDPEARKILKKGATKKYESEFSWA